jgi:hypothetical protein
MTCPACGQEERQDRKTVLGKARPLTLHRECLSGHAWHMPLVIKPETRPALCDCRPESLMHSDTAHRGRLLYVALGFLGLDVPPSAMPGGLGLTLALVRRRWLADLDEGPIDAPP